ncbi:SIS domain-containing protein [Bombilactobacillus thymidiniphilus]|uniref:SIS domain-containing protein n=1 Tax=Bombilactobacillus thymidiniphilus TaxID=2923363 RepID=A0ABY4PCD7_9LACO|nr:SIS domain-containing protein [Bombilactobacillus thymidiniphilus]UQS83433.1 SIS domain-containing protein [Bombilactobacillus thymidiniphilus]
MKSITDYVNLEPDFYEKALKQQSTALQPLLAALKERPVDEVVLFATGSSANASYAAVPFMSQVLNCPIHVEEPSLAANYLVHNRPQTLYIAISQGGHSYSVIHLVQKLQQLGQMVWVLTSDLTSPLSKVSNHVWSMCMEHEQMPYVSAGYSVTILDLVLLAMQLGLQQQTIGSSKYDQYYQAIQQIIEQMPQVIKRSTSWVENCISEFQRAQRFIFIGYGATYGIAREGETKITETVRVTASGKELEEYMHGPYIGLAKTDCIIFIDPQGKLQARQQKLQQFLQPYVSQVSIIYANQSALAEAMDLQLQVSCDELLAALFMTIPIHLLAAQLSQAAGIDLTVSAYPDFDQITASKI